MILAFVETRAYALFQTTEFLSLSESMVQMIMCRNLEIPEVRKFEAMLAWTKHKVSAPSGQTALHTTTVCSLFPVPGEIQSIRQNRRQGRVPLHHGTASAGPETTPNLTAGVDQDRTSLEGHQKRTHPGDVDVPGEQWNVPDTGQLSGGLPTAAAEAGLPLQRVGRKLRLWLIGRGSAVVKQLILVVPSRHRPSWLRPDFGAAEFFTPHHHSDKHCCRVVGRSAEPPSCSHEPAVVGPLLLCVTECVLEILYRELLFLSVRCM